MFELDNWKAGSARTLPMGFRIRAVQGLISMPVGEIKYGVVADAFESSRYDHRNQP